MNDPHVVALVYRMEHGDFIDYRKAKPFRREEQSFRLRVANGEVRFKLHDHFPTIETADRSLADYKRAWEFDAQLKHGPDSFRLVLDHGKSEVIDRQPPPGPSPIFLHDEITASDSAQALLQPAAYPEPPANLAISPDAKSMHRRYMGYLEGHEPLGAMAYFCLTVLEGLPQERSEKRLLPRKRKAAAASFAIDESVLAEIGRLSSSKGGADARKREGTGQPLSTDERHFLEGAMKAIIRRVAEKGHSPAGTLPKISLSDLPPLKNKAHHPLESASQNSRLKTP